MKSGEHSHFIYIQHWEVVLQSKATKWAYTEASMGAQMTIYINLL